MIGVLAFTAALLGGLTVLTYAGSAAVQRTLEAWSEADAAARTSLAVARARESLVVHVSRIPVAEDFESEFLDPSGDRWTRFDGPSVLAHGARSCGCGTSEVGGVNA